MNLAADVPHENSNHNTRTNDWFIQKKGFSISTTNIIFGLLIFLIIFRLCLFDFIQPIT